ncbi:MAG: hypothetical protein EU981_02190 [Candidatus Liberibacter ctenarytainae]|uniref:Uncharacterized protein n=1 Tax=Candidatus Liberibacter ctenarytainae TaxID=2020335 RepID=A0A937AK21_9HYPH|nr:hypothetical protein [Candidatus Liberibacter ctenarytainae]
MVTLDTIANQALQKLGVQGISSLEEDTEVAKDCRLALPSVIGSLLRRYSWGFAETVQIVPRINWEDNGTYKFRFPSGFISLLHTERDWEVLGEYIYTSNDQPIRLKYIRYVEDPRRWDHLFRECVVLKLAVTLCDRLVQSESKKAFLSQELKSALEEAKEQERSGRDNQPWQWG